MPRKLRLGVRISYRGMTADEILDEYPEKYLVCRGNHDWPVRAMWRDLSDTARERIILCRRCGYKKTRIEDMNGNLLLPETTRHPHGYLTPRSGLKRGQFVALAHTRDYQLAKIQGRVRDGSSDTLSELPA